MKLLPVIGDILENVQSKDGGEARVDPEKLVNQLARIAATIIGTWLLT